MSFTNINGKEVEVLEPEKEIYADLLQPNLFTPDRNSNILFVDNNGNIHMIFQEKTHKKIFIKRRNLPIVEQVSILGKKKLEQAFGLQIYKEKERYGQDIPADFFGTNIGHLTYTESDTDSEIINWCYKYLATKNKF